MAGIGLRDGEVVPLVVTLGVVEAVTERLEYALVEAPARGAVGDPDPDVVEHRYFRRAPGFACVGCARAVPFGGAPDCARAARGPSLPRNATSMPFSEK